MQPLYAAAILLLLSASLAWAGDAFRPSPSPVRVKSAQPAFGNLHLQRALDQRNQASQLASNVLRARSEISQTFARNMR